MIKKSTFFPVWAFPVGIGFLVIFIVLMVGIFMSINATPATIVEVPATISTTPATKAASGSLIPMGVPVRVADWEITVLRTIKPGQKLGSNGAAALGTWTVLKISLKNVGKVTNSVGIGSFYTGLLDKTIFYADASSLDYAETQNGKRLNTSIPPGIAITTYAAFDTAPDLKGLLFIFAPDKDNIQIFSIVQ